MKSISNKIKKYEAAFNEQKKASLAWDELNKKENELYDKYMVDFAGKINDFLSSIGVNLIFDYKKDLNIDHFIYKHSELDDKKIEDIFAYSDSLPRFESGINFPDQKSGLAFRTFLNLNLPIDLKQKDFSSKEIFEDYKQCVYSATHDFD